MSSNEVIVVNNNTQMQFIDSINMGAVEKSVNKINTIQATLKEVLVKGKDYGVIPYCGDKPTLLKPGAEKIQMAFNLLVEYDLIKSTEDFETGFFSYTVKAVAKDAKGVIIANGLGHCNSLERKQQTRKDRTDEERRQTAIDKANTVLKMAKKRAQVDCILTVGSLSDVFTQDIEDFEHENRNGNNNGDNKFGKVNTSKFKAMVGKYPDIEKQVKQEFGVTTTKDFEPNKADQIFARVEELKNKEVKQGA